jgi:hypothetical protein
MEPICRCGCSDSLGGVMIDIRKYHVHDLPEWLDIATNGLASPVKERIRSEIESHYAESVAAHLLESLSESVARRKALADLGSPDEAASCDDDCR